MARGFKTGGRIKGSKNKRTLLLEGAARQVQGDAKRILGDEAFEGDAHSLLVLIYKDNSLPLAVRLDAAKTAIRFEKPVMSAVRFRGIESRVRNQRGAPDAGRVDKTELQQRELGRPLARMNVRF